MFCLACRYDLRGLASARCPECGTPFDWADPGTFYPTFPNRRTRFGRWARDRRRRIWTISVSLVAVAWWWTADELPVQYRYVHPSRLSSSNLQGLLLIWILDQHDQGRPNSFDQPRLRDEINSSYSARTQYKVGRIKAGVQHWYDSGYVFLHLGLLLLLLVVFNSLARRKHRRASIIVACLIILPLADALTGKPILSFALPGDQEYVNDYLFLPDADLISRNPQRGNTVVAYEKHPIQGFRRMVGFGDGHVVGLPDKQLIPLLSAQGIQLSPEAVPTEP